MSTTTNSTKIYEYRFLYYQAFRDLCEKRKWFTKKGGVQYVEKMFAKDMLRIKTCNLTTRKLQKLAQDVMKYSEPQTYEILGLGGVMYCINEICSFNFLEEPLMF